MKEKSKTSKTWVKTPVANLYRYAPSGGYYMRAKIHGEDVKKSLDTKSFEIARTNLSTVHDGESGRILKAKEHDGEKQTVAQLIERFKKKDEANRDIKDSTRSHHLDYVRCIEARWAELPAMNAAKVSRVECEQWAERFQQMDNKRNQKYSAAHYNGTIDILRLIMEQAVEMGIRADNPAAKLKRLEVKRKPIILPTNEKFKELLKRLGALPERKRALRFIKFLAYGGPRIGTARAIMPNDVDFKRNEITLRKSKNDVVVRLPMIPKMRKLMKELIKDYPGQGPLLGIKNPRRALKNACKEAGIEPMTNHHLRHLFTTICLESGIDVRTVAQWRGDKDNGAMLLKNYAHVRRDHSQSMARLVKFG